MAKALFDGNSIATSNLLDTAPIVADSVVSKTLLNNDNCKMVLFAMDAGQSISEHHAPYVGTVHVLDGQLAFGIGGQKHTLNPNDWLIMPFDEKHDLVATVPTRFLLVLVR